MRAYIEYVISKGVSARKILTVGSRERGKIVAEIMQDIMKEVVIPMNAKGSKGEKAAEHIAQNLNVFLLILCSLL